jgi:putative ABC transport system ATP-binding protein
MIRLSDLRFRWERGMPPVIDIPAFEVAAGERVLLTGASGSGKTTLLNLLAGVSAPESGEIGVMGTDLARLGGAGRDAFRADHIGYVFQSFNLLPYLGVIDNVVLPCRFSDLRRRRALAREASLEAEARRLLRRMALEVDSLASRPVNRLSAGQQQRVAAARSLIGGPALLIADEPTSALDADTQSEFLHLLFGEVQALGITLLVVSHDRRLEGLFDRVVPLASINRAAPP